MTKAHTTTELDKELNIILPNTDTSVYPSDANLEIYIPRNLFITWKSTDPETILERWRPAYDTLFDVMPHWTIIYTDDEQNRYIVEKYFPDFLPYYDAFEYNIQRVDAVRCLMLYIWGGVYKDMDMEIINPIDSLFVNSAEVYFVSSPNMKNMLTNSFMASKPRSSFWLSYVEHMKHGAPNWAIGKHLKVMTTTGPMALDKLAKESDIVYAALPRSLVCPCSLCDIESCNSEDAMIRPIWGSTWVSYDSQIYNFVFCYWRKASYYSIILVLIIIILAFLIWLYVIMSL